MAGQSYTTQQGRHEKFKGRTLAKAVAQEMLTKVGDMDEVPQNTSELIEWLRYLPFGGVDNQWIAAGGDTDYIAKHIIQEGVTPSPDSMSWTTLSTTLQEIGCLYSYTNKMRRVHEQGEEIPKEMEDQLATRIALTREMMCYGELKGAAFQYFGGAGSSIGTVNGPPNLSMFQDISRQILGQHGTTIREMLASSPKYETKGIQASWPVYCHTDMEKTFENMPGFTKTVDYGGQTELWDKDYEIGAIGRFRVIINPILTYLPNAGALNSAWVDYAGTGAANQGKATPGSSNVDVYPLIIPGIGKGGGHAFGQVALRGYNALMVNHIPPEKIEKTDMLGQRGYVGGCTWQAQKVLNDGWMAVAYVGTYS